MAIRVLEHKPALVRQSNQVAKRNSDQRRLAELDGLGVDEQGEPRSSKATPEGQKRKE